MAITKNNYSCHHYNKLGGVGLGIIVALENSRSTGAGEVLVKYTAVGAPPSPHSDPIKVIRPETNSSNNKRRICISGDHDDGDDDEENYTYVTCRGPNKSTTRVYHHNVEDHDSRRRTRKAPVSKTELQQVVDSHSWSEFLQSCDLCRKPLLGKDIYMYRGEKAFCSEECRQRQIASDERKEKLCRAEASKSSSSSSEMVSRSPCYYERGQIFSSGIVAV